MKEKKPNRKEKYNAPTAQVVEVSVEQGFAATAPYFNDGGSW